MASQEDTKKNIERKEPKTTSQCFLKKRTLFAFGEIFSTIDELEGTHPLNTAPPP